MIPSEAALILMLMLAPKRRPPPGFAGVEQDLPEPELAFEEVVGRSDFEGSAAVLRKVLLEY